MTRLRELIDNAKVYDVFLSRPDVFVPFTEACENMMRAPSALSAGERELIGAFVSKLNECPYCHDVHNEAVKAYDLGEELTSQLQDDIDTAGIDDKLKPLFKLSKKMTQGAYRITDADLDACYAAGWDDAAILDTVSVTCLFNFMNRLVSTLGIVTDDDYLQEVGERIKEVGYSGAINNMRETGSHTG